MRAVSITFAVLLASVLTQVAPAHATDPVCGFDVCGTVGGDGGQVGLSEKQTRDLPTKKRAPVTVGTKTVVKTVRLEYQTVLACPANIGGEDIAACTKAYTACDNMPNATGPLVRIRFRTVLPANAHGDWQAGGETCYPNWSRTPSTNHD